MTVINNIHRYEINNIICEYWSTAADFTYDKLEDFMKLARYICILRSFVSMNCIIDNKTFHVTKISDLEKIINNLAFV